MERLRRFIWYLAGRLFLLLTLLSLFTVTFYYAMNMANIQVVLKDGMAYRAQVVMMDADPSELTKYFMPSFLEQDQVLLAVQQGNSPYKDYNVRGIDHRLEMEWMWCWPWDNTASANFVESVPKIDGRIKSSLRQQAEEADPSRVYPPDWTSGRYVATLVRVNGRWKIASIKLLETIQ